MCKSHNRDDDNRSSLNNATPVCLDHTIRSHKLCRPDIQGFVNVKKFSGHERQGYPKSLGVLLTEIFFLNLQRYSPKNKTRDAHEQDTDSTTRFNAKEGVQSNHLIS